MAWQQMKLGERLESDDDAREMLMIREMPYEPFLASVLFGLGSLIDGLHAVGGNAEASIRTPWWFSQMSQVIWRFTT